VAWLLLAALPSSLLSLPSAAFGAEPAKTPSAEAAAEAHQHADRAHELYGQGAYRESIAELEAALKLDPNGKGLVFNLGVVHEKLGDIDDALRYFQRYELMDLDAAERAKADAYVKRLQGARKEVEKTPEATPAPPPPPPPPPPQRAPEPPAHGKIDGWTVGAGVLALGGYAVGTIFGVEALRDKPKSGTMTTGTLGYQHLQSAVDTAHREAIVSDVAFATAAVATLLTTYLFFGRTKNPASRSSGKASSKPLPVVISGSPLPNGGALFLGALF
jgi:tetratricopeptide (TPR) repeat protein